MVRRAALAVVVLLAVAASSRANDLMVDSRSIEMNDLLTITVSLEGTFATVDSVSVPLANLAFVGEPWVSSEFAWINGDVVRRKIFRFRARPLAPGPARVGPLVLTSEDGQQETLNALGVQVTAGRVSGSNDAETVLRELIATGRDPLFVVAEVDKSSVYVGEPVVITWMLYNAATVQQWQIANVPKLADFWTEELSLKNDLPERVYVGDVMMQRIPIRRAALVPLRSGTLRVEGMTLEASVMRRTRSGPFSMFEGELTETSFTSAGVDVTAKPLPPGPPVDVVGDLALDCQPPLQRNGGPVVLNVILSGRGHVRAATPPHFSTSVDGEVQMEGGEVTVAREEGVLSLTRRWRYLIFPRSAGMLDIPPLVMTSFAPALGQRKELRCEGSTLTARTSGAVAAQHRVEDAPPEPGLRTRWVPWLAGAMLLALFLALAVPPLRRTLALRREVESMVRERSASEIRASVEARVDGAALLREPSERGDAYRAVRSLLEAAERDRDIAVDAEEEIERRLRELLILSR